MEEIVGDFLPLKGGISWMIMRGFLRAGLIGPDVFAGTALTEAEGGIVGLRVEGDADESTGFAWFGCLGVLWSTATPIVRAPDAAASFAALSRISFFKPSPFPFCHRHTSLSSSFDESPRPLFTAFKQWAEDQSMRPINRDTFIQRVLSAAPSVSYKNTRIDGRMGRHFFGVKEQPWEFSK